MKKILLDETEIHFRDANFPIRIHGVDGSGASLYTISLAAHMHADGNEILFLCGYPMAEQEFLQQVGTPSPRAKFYTQERADAFIEQLALAGDDAVIVVKNAELFSEQVIAAALTHAKVVISGDLERSAAKELLRSRAFTTSILFSALGTEALPELAKYQAAFSSAERRGITRLE